MGGNRRVRTGSLSSEGVGEEAQGNIASKQWVRRAVGLVCGIAGPVGLECGPHLPFPHHLAACVDMCQELSGL